MFRQHDQSSSKPKNSKKFIIKFNDQVDEATPAMQVIEGQSFRLPNAEANPQAPPVLRLGQWSRRLYADTVTAAMPIRWAGGSTAAWHAVRVAKTHAIQPFRLHPAARELFQPPGK